MDKPKVGIIMGSDSDLEVMSPAAKVLEELEVPYELTVGSAHRCPEEVADYAKKAAGRGIDVIIAGAGGAAHLPGVIAAMTAIPVIGVPVRGSSFSGMDSLLSIVQMPRGIPVATVGVNNSKNAGILAVSILGTGDKKYRKAVEQYKEKMKGEVLKKAEKLEEIGYEAYLKEM